MVEKLKRSSCSSDLNLEMQRKKASELLHGVVFKTVLLHSMYDFNIIFHESTRKSKRCKQTLNSECPMDQAARCIN
jgi:hypothetical protein